MKSISSLLKVRPRILLVAAILLIAATGGLWLGNLSSRTTSGGHTVMEERPQRRDFSLTDADGNKVTLASYQGKWLVMFFGFTTCPEICPLAMQTVLATSEKLAETGRGIQPIFITIDPERDTPGVLKDYLSHFGAGIDGLSGTKEETTAIAKLYGVYYQKRPLDNDYTMDHSTALYLIAPDGRYVRPFKSDLESANLAAEIVTAMESWKG